MELVEVAPPYDQSEITALMGTRVIVDVLGAMVSNGTLGKHKGLIDKPVSDAACWIDPDLATRRNTSNQRRLRALDTCNTRCFDFLETKPSKVFDPRQREIRQRG